MLPVPCEVAPQACAVMAATVRIDPKLEAEDQNAQIKQARSNVLTNVLSGRFRNFGLVLQIRSLTLCNKNTTKRPTALAESAVACVLYAEPQMAQNLNCGTRESNVAHVLESAFRHSHNWHPAQHTQTSVTLRDVLIRLVQARHRPSIRQVLRTELCRPCCAITSTAVKQLVRNIRVPR